MLKLISLIIIYTVFCYTKLYSQDTLIYINEILTSNESINKDRYNDYDDWIEIYNPNNFPINLANYFISDDKNNLKKTSIPNTHPGFSTIQPKQFKIIWFDNNTNQGPLHINLKLSSKKGEIILTKYDGKTIIDKVEYQKQRIDISYGRKPDGCKEFRFFINPSPEKSNNAEISFVGISENPILSKYGGFYNKEINIKIESPENSKIYYTIDGNIPDEKTGILYNQNIIIDTTSVLRIKIFEKDKIPSLLFSQTYFINEKYTIPVISLTTNKIELFISTDPKINVYKENPINIEYYDLNQKQILNTLAGFKLVGKAIRNYPQKSMSIRFRSSYGQSSYKYNFFQNKDKSKYSALLLRNSGNDCGQTLFKDALLHNLVINNTNIDCQAYQPVIVFLNGKYWGIHNMREKINKYYIESNHKNIDIENIDMIEWGSKPIHGDNKHYNYLLKFISNSDITSPANYDTILNLIDIDNFIDYQIAEIFYANTDWPMANMKYWRPRTTNGKWRWIMFDTDLAFDLNKQRCPGHHNTIDYALGINNCHLPHLSKSLYESTILMRTLINNENFKKDFIIRFCDLMNTIFSPDNITNTIIQMKKDIEPEMSKHIDRWGNEYGINSLESWNNNIVKLITFGKERADTMRMFINEKFNLGGIVNFKISINNNNNCKIKVNTIEIDNSNNNLFYFKNMPIKIEAISSNECKFIKWSDGNKNTIRTIDLSKITEIQAIFE